MESNRWNPTRRQVWQAALRGTAGVTFGLPLLDIFLNSSGTALANGAPLPVRFGTWMWGLGFQPGRFFPTKEGADYDFQPELKPLEPLKRKLSVFSDFRIELDGASPSPHIAGISTLRTGSAPGSAGERDRPSFDVLISDQLSAGHRFRSIDVACAGNPQDSFSRQSATLLNPAEVSPVALYTRIFGSDFQDPNTTDFKPDPKMMVRRSILSDVSEQRAALVAKVGADDRRRLDQYFTSFRQVENQLALALEKPAPALACKIPGKLEDVHTGDDITQARATNKLMAQMIAMALACNQTRVFNVALSNAASVLRKAGDPETFHVHTHDERIDPAIGYQPASSWFTQQSMEGAHDFLAALDAIPEGDGTLLDHSLVFLHSDCSIAKIHSLENLPMMLAGSANGRLKTGLHIAGHGTPCSRVVLTAMQGAGLGIGNWGTQSMQTSRTVSEILV